MLSVHKHLLNHEFFYIIIIAHFIKSKPVNGEFGGLKDSKIEASM